VLAGGCVPVGGDGLPYAPVVEALRSLPEEFGADAMPELAGPSWQELTRVLPSLGESEAGVPGQVTQPRLFELLLGLLGHLSEQTSVALVVEDLHWADQSTRDLLAFLVRNLRQKRILLVVTYRIDEPRTEGLGPYLAELERGGSVQRLELPRLNRAETAAQLTGILDAAPAADLVESVFVRSEGNPFFTEELLAVVRAGSQELPATLRDLLRGRVARLPEPARQALSAVAVAGRRVPHRLLAAVVGLDHQQLVGGLRAAISDQLLVTAAGQDGYDVRHALFREVIDADLLPGERMNCMPVMPTRSPGGQSWPKGRSRPSRPNWPSTGMQPVCPPGPCRPGWMPARPPNGPTPSPRPCATTSVPWNCGAKCRNLIRWPGWIGLSC
jgi:hypothetical protein